jgi:hypothetical protein
MDHEYSKLHSRPKSSQVLPAPVMAIIPVRREPKMNDLRKFYVDRARLQASVCAG